MSEELEKQWRRYKYKNLTLLGLGLALAAFLSQYDGFHQALVRLGNFGYLSAFLAGLFFTFSFTIPTSTVILFILAETLTAWEIGLIAGLGAVTGDLSIFKAVRGGLLLEIKPLYEGLGGREITKLLHTKYFRWTLPLVGALIIASPLPDEIGVSLLGLSKMSLPRFLFVSFVLNALGIVVIISAASLL